MIRAKGINLEGVRETIVFNDGRFDKERTVLEYLLRDNCLVPIFGYMYVTPRDSINVYLVLKHKYFSTLESIEEDEGIEALMKSGNIF